MVNYLVVLFLLFFLTQILQSQTVETGEQNGNYIPSIGKTGGHLLGACGYGYESIPLFAGFDCSTASSNASQACLDHCLSMNLNVVSATCSKRSGMDMCVCCRHGSVCSADKYAIDTGEAHGCDTLIQPTAFWCEHHCQRTHMTYSSRCRPADDHCICCKDNPCPSSTQPMNSGDKFDCPNDVTCRAACTMSYPDGLFAANSHVCDSSNRCICCFYEPPPTEATSGIESPTEAASDTESPTEATAPESTTESGISAESFHSTPPQTSLQPTSSAPQSRQPFLSECEGVKNFYLNQNLTVGQCVKFNGVLYWMINEKFTWDEAEGNCRMVAGHLGSIHTSDEDNVIKLFVKYENKTKIVWPGPWIGLHRVDFKCPNPFTFWSDGSKNNYSSNNQWIIDEPNCGSGHESCVQYVYRPWHGYGWNDRNCSVPQEAICKVQCV